jgi:hypothetical protein
MYKGWALKTSPYTATFNDLLCLYATLTDVCRWLWSGYFHYRVLRRIFGHRRDEIIGGWRKFA